MNSLPYYSSKPPKDQKPLMPEPTIYLVTTTVTRYGAQDLPKAIEAARQGRGQGKRTEIVFRHDEVARRGLLGNMQDLLELERELLP